jgi:hypothetical protein
MMTQEELARKHEARRKAEEIWIKRFEAVKPEWAAAAIIAELEKDKSDSMTDLFLTSTLRRVILGFSRHTRDLFGEMRKHAAKMPETEHLSKGKAQYTARVVLLTDNRRSNGGAMYAGQFSPWHREESDNAPTYYTESEIQAWINSQPAIEPIIDGETECHFAWKITSASMEHREKYSMGAGYYLKASGRYSTGWKVEKVRLGGPGQLFPADLSIVEARR